jgi:predicted TIM-barrel enzyme
MAEAGADGIIAHVGTTVGGSIGVEGATCSMDEAIERTQKIIEAVKRSNPDTFFLTHGGPINTPDDVRVVLDHTDAHGFVGASSLERMGVEQSLTDLTRAFKSLSLSK